MACGSIPPVVGFASVGRGALFVASDIRPSWSSVCHSVAHQAGLLQWALYLSGMASGGTDGSAEPEVEQQEGIAFVTRTGRPKRALVLAAVVAVLATAGYSWAQRRTSALAQADVHWNSDPEALLVSYREVWAELANQDPTPLIRIYGDGRVVVHHADYTPRAGEYQLQLRSEELESLLLSLLANGVATFEPAAVKRSKVAKLRLDWEAAVAADEPPELFMVADESTSIFELHIAGYRPAGAVLTQSEIHRTITWTGLATDATRFPEVEAIQRLRTAELELRALLERDSLRRIPR